MRGTEKNPNPQPPHTLEDFELELQSLRGSILTMGQIAMDMVEQIGKLLQHNQKVDASEAKGREKDLDQLEAEVDQQARVILIKYQPVATDLRGVTGAVRIATDLEQIGDDARRISIQAPKLTPWLAFDSEGVLEEQWKLSQKALVDGVASFSYHDPVKASQVTEFKRQTRKLAKDARSRISKAVAKNKALATSFVEAVNVTHGLENISLHACSLGEAVVFIETATDRRDRRENI
ncbi:MAG: PhoU domain-containing protein [Verrucomicrobiota bacterium]